MKFLQRELAALSDVGLRRTLRTHNDSPGRLIDIDGQSVINFSSNNYLGLANHPLLISAAHEALIQGTGSTSSRLVTGNLGLHRQLENELASFHQCESARVFNSGYHANVGLMSCLAESQDLIISDALNHASMIDGCRLSKATVRIANHCDVAAFEACLKDGQSSSRRMFVLTESVFSMDGDLAPLFDLRSLCDQYNAFLIVDDVHALGVLGHNGAGLCSRLDVIPDVLVGGFGKAFGSFGGYIAGSYDLTEFLLNRARSFIFSTALPAPVVAANLASVQLVRSVIGNELQTTVGKRIETFRKGLHQLDLLEPGAGYSSIFPILVGDSSATVQLTETLLSHGVFCQAIRPPTVEVGRARLRVLISAMHTEQDIDQLLAALADVL